MVTIMSILLIFGLLVPLIYGLKTLRELPSVWVYPIFRLRRQSEESVVMKTDSGGKGMLTGVAMVFPYNLLKKKED